jgi:hypothetical protein
MYLHNCYQTLDAFFYVIDFARGGYLFNLFNLLNLLNLLKQNLNLSFEDEKIYLVEIGIAIERIYSKSFICRDISFKID